jgi:hypothetical protein
MKLTYWYAKLEDDANCYSIRERTKREAVAEKNLRGPERFGPVVKVEVEYASAFDLMKDCMSEGGLGEESQAHWRATNVR